MAWVRGQERFVSELVTRQLKTRLLEDLQWDGSLGHLPYGALAPITFVEMRPDPKLEPIGKNVVALSAGRMPDDVDQEMGGNLQQTTHTFFIDIYAESASIARVLAADVRSIFTGRAPGCSRMLMLPNYATSGEPYLPGHLVEFEDVDSDFPEGLGQTHWAVVKLSAIHTWNV